MKNLRIILTICFGLSAATLVAQSRHYNSATLGMGGGGTAYVDGYHANFLNPANLMLQQANRPKRSLGIVGGLGFRAGGSLLNFGVYNQYLTTGLTINGQVREDMLNDWFGSNDSNTRELAGTLSIVPFGFSNRGNKMAFSLATRVRTTQDLTINKGFMELAFYGFDSGNFSSPVPVNFNYRALSFAEVSVGFAMELPIPLTGLVEKLPFINGIKVYAGAAPKYIVGIQSTELDFTSNLTVNSISGATEGSIVHDFNYSLYTYGEISDQLTAYSNAREIDPDAKLGDFFDYSGSDVGTLGSGFGLDLGITAELDVSLPALGFFGKRQILRLSMSMTDLGSVNYNSSPSRVTAGGIVTIDGDVGDKTPNEYFSDLGDSLQNDVYGGFSSEALSAQKYQLPGMYNFGAALTLGKLTTTLDYGFGFNDVGTNSKRSALTLGTEYRFFGILPVRFGTRVGGYSSATYSAGLGLDLRFLELTFAASTVANSGENGSSAAVAWSGLLIRF
tara:strand:- start:67005 stop:68516 length:1512 start_codon:yes stop_codon:yes gene_type:complete